MNNMIYNPFFRFQNNIDIERIINKIERLEKDIRILENRINELEKKEVIIKAKEEPSDMYMI